MKKINAKNVLTRNQLKNVTGGVKNVNDGCPDGLTEWTCVSSAPGTSGLDGLIYATYCLPAWEPSPCGPGPA